MQHGLRTGNAGSERDEGNRVHSVLEVDEAAKVSGDISDDGGAGADHEDGNDKGGVAIVNGWEKEMHDHSSGSESKCIGARGFALSKCIPGAGC